MNRSKEFAKNTLILLIGKFSTQFMSLLLLPLFTHYLVANDYGYVDLLQTYICLFVPVLTLRLDSSTFRFLLEARDNKNEQKNIITNTTFVLIVTIFLTILLSQFLKAYIKLNYYNWMIMNILVLMITNIYMQILRGLGKNKEYSIVSIITGFTTLLCNIILILVYKLGANSILISSIVANIICFTYIVFKTDLFTLMDLKIINKKSIKSILRYSVPMIPNSLSWWIVNVSDRTIISYFIGSTLNGIYTVSCKFSNILNSFFSIFNMSWQETTSMHINDKDANSFFSKMINQLVLLFGSLGLLIQAIIPIFFDLLIGKEYLTAYNYIPILLYANTWNVIISLFGGIYIALKRTKEIAHTTIISAIINLIIHLILIQFIGLFAACVSTLVSYMAMGIYRSIDIKKYINVRLKIKSLIIYTFLFIMSALVYLYNKFTLNIINLLVTCTYCFIVNKDMLFLILSKFRKRIHLFF